MKRSTALGTTAFAAALLISSTSLAASSSSVVPIGEGKYMLTGRNMTVFGSADGIAAKLMVKANEYCQQKNKSEAVLLNMAGESSQMGVRTASSTIYFRCGSAEAERSKPAAQANALPDSYYERVKHLHKQVIGGEIASSKGFISSQASPAFTQLPASDAAMLEGRSTWWIDDDGRWFIHIQNVTSATLEAFEFTLTDGSCASPTTAPDKSIIQLERPISAGDQAVVNFNKPLAGDSSSEQSCGVISAAWAVKQ